MPHLQVKNLSFTYSRGTPFEHRALDGVSFSIEKGEFVGFIGHTGSGKSTLMQQINGLLKPESGSVYLNGEDIFARGYDLRGVRFRVGLVFQYPEYQLFEETVYRDIAFGPRNMGIAGDELDARVRDSAAMVGLDAELLEKSPFELSGGEKRRAAIAGVLAMEPEILILDEPTAGLDPQGRIQLMEMIKEYHEKKHATVLLVTHSMEDIARCAQRIIVMNESKIIMDGPTEEIFGRSEELLQIGLDVPQITRVFMELERMGMHIDTSVYTVKYAKNLILRMMEDRTHDS